MKKEWVVAGYLLLISILFRLPFYFVDVIDWDESTFIIMGQSVLNGQLPYTELWDLKPPLAFATFALIIWLLGKSILAIRIAGTLCVFLTSWFLYLIGKQLKSDRVGIFAGSLFIVLSAIIKGGQSTLSEHVALPFLVAGLALLVIRKPTWLVLLGTGILLTWATLIRLNLAYVTMAVGFWLLLGKFKFKNVTAIGIVAYVAGSFCLILLTYIPYLLTGNGNIWLDSVILAPLSYSSSQTSSEKPLLILVLILWLGGIWLIAKRRKITLPTKQYKLGLLQVFFVATGISIIQGGALFQHYYIQLMPFFALSVGLLWDVPHKNRFVATIAIAILLASQLEPIFAQYQTVSHRLMTGKSLVYGGGYEIADYLQQKNPDRQPVYMMSHHIVYWFTGLQPLSKSTTHPSNISKEYLLQHMVGAENSTEAELAKIFAKEPKFIIKRPVLFYLEEGTPAFELLQKTLATKYRPIDRIHGQEIYQIN